MVGRIWNKAIHVRIRFVLSSNPLPSPIQPMVSKDIVKCTNTLTLSNVLHALSFSINLLSISVIVFQLNYVVSFNIPKVIFLEKRTGKMLGIGMWYSGLWNIDKEGMNSTLSSIVKSSRGVVVHYDVWVPCSTTSISFRYFVTFLGCSHVTWLYLMKNKVMY